MPEHVVEVVTSLLNEQRIAVNGSRVLILGVAYKPDVADMRESPALDVIRLLAERGAEISFHDPLVPEVVVEGTSYKGSDLSDERLSGADLVVILTNHSGVDYGRVVAGARKVFDTRNATREVPGAAEKVRFL